MAFIDFTDDPDTRHELRIDNDVKFAGTVPGRTRPTSPVTKRGNSLINTRCKRIDDRSVRAVCAIGIAFPRVRRNVKESEVRRRMSHRRQYVPDHILGTGEYLDCSDTAIRADSCLR